MHADEKNRRQGSKNFSLVRAVTTTRAQGQALALGAIG